MSNLTEVVVFALDEGRYALSLAAVERVVRLVEITPLSAALDIVIGIINVQGQVLPVINIRKQFQLPERQLTLSDQLIIARTSRRRVALVVDAVGGILERPEQSLTTAEEILPGIAHVHGVVKLEDGVILIHDLDKCLSIEEETLLDDAIANG
jgi:purine-binding chemotaxis protein CheW